MKREDETKKKKKKNTDKSLRRDRGGGGREGQEGERGCWEEGKQRGVGRDAKV